MYVGGELGKRGAGGGFRGEIRERKKQRDGLAQKLSLKPFMLVFCVDTSTGLNCTVVYEFEEFDVFHGCAVIYGFDVSNVSNNTHCDLQIRRAVNILLEIPDRVLLRMEGLKCPGILLGRTD